MIDSQQASEALADINDIVRRVRQSRLYYLNSLIMVLWGVLVFAGKIATWLRPRYGGSIWFSLDISGTFCLFVLTVFSTSPRSAPTFLVPPLLPFPLFFF